MVNPTLAGGSINDAYRCLGRRWTAPLLLLEPLSPELRNSKAWTAGYAAALVGVAGCLGELVVAGDLSLRWFRWAVSMAFSLFLCGSCWLDCLMPRSQNRVQAWFAPP